jgi:hypothetical protein
MGDSILIANSQIIIESLRFWLVFIVAVFSGFIIILGLFNFYQYFRYEKFKDEISSLVDKINARNTFLDNLHIFINPSLEMPNDRRLRILMKMFDTLILHRESFKEDLNVEISILISNLRNSLRYLYEDDKSGIFRLHRWIFLINDDIENKLDKIVKLYDDFIITNEHKLFSIDRLDAIAFLNSKLKY